MQKELTVALDIDGTIINEKGLLNPKVVDIFRKADLNRTRFILTTAASYSQAKGVIKQINGLFVNKKIKPWVLTSCGSTMYNPNGKKEIQIDLEKDFIAKYTKIVKAVDPDAMIIYRSNEKNFFMKEHHSLKTKFFFKMYKNKERIKNLLGKSGVKFKKFRRNPEKLYNFKDIQNLFVVSLNKEKRKVIKEKLTKLCDDYGFPLYDGKVLQTPAISKAMGIRSICKDFSNLAYFGDSENDAEMLKLANYSFARGKHANKSAVENAKYHYNSLNAKGMSVVDALYSSEEEFDEKMSKLPKTDLQKTKQNQKASILVEPEKEDKKGKKRSLYNSLIIESILSRRKEEREKKRVQKQVDALPDELKQLIEKCIQDTIEVYEIEKAKASEKENSNVQDAKIVEETTSSTQSNTDVAKEEKSKITSNPEAEVVLV